MDAMTSPVGRRDAYDVLTAPVIIFVGHFGSGKSEIALNLAFDFRARGHEVSIVDLDVVKPYFRCRLAHAELAEKGIHLVAPEGDRFYADLPIIVPEVRGALSRSDDGNARVIVDAGGDDLGARAFGAMSDLVDRARTELLFVVNTRRPFAEDQAGLSTMLREVETAARMSVTGLVANTHLMEETTPEIVLGGLEAARTLSAATGIPVRFCAALRRLVGSLDRVDCPLLPIDRHVLPPDKRPRRGPLGRPMGI
ncbi:MAG: cobalamin biosynthesis protein CbiA [Acidobacteriia bacterium]|nr:cobalamin biosynthesis protein CbiA [Terriglobia bacterium]